MSKRFVIEAIMIAVYGQLLVPSRSVEFLIPYSSISELYEIAESEESIMIEDDYENDVRRQINELIRCFEDPFNKKKIQRSLQQPWKKSSFLFHSADVRITVVNAIDHAQYGDEMDPIETELILVSAREQAPILTDQTDFIHRLLDLKLPIQVIDIEDFDYALEDLKS